MGVADGMVGAVQGPAVGRPQFDAFMSYSHAVDGRLAPALQQGVQTLGKPWHRRRVLHVFRDQTSLSASPGLWPDIERALAMSRFFILLASPEAADSSWVRKEVLWWREHRASERLLIAVTDGSLAWDSERDDFDGEASSALPGVLRGCFAREPLWVDLRWARAERQVSSRDPRFRDCIADLAAPLHGCPKDELIGEDIRNHRRAIRLARGAGATLALITAAAIVAAILAIGQRNAARHETLLATSRQLAAQSQAAGPSRLDTSLLLSHAAWRTAQTPQALAALLQANTASPQLVALTTQQQRITSIASEPGASMIATGASDGTVRLWRPAVGGATMRVAGLAAAAVSATAFGGTDLAVGDAAGNVGVYVLPARRWVWPIQSQAHPITAVAVDGADGTVASASSLGGKSTIEISRAAAHARSARVTVAPVLGSPITRLAFNGANRLVVGAFTGQVFVFSLMPTLRYLGTSTQYTATDGSNIGAYSADMKSFGVSGGGVSRTDAETTSLGQPGLPAPARFQFPPTAPNPPLAVALAPDGRRLAVSGSTEVTVLRRVGIGGADPALATTTLTGLASLGSLTFPDEDHIVGTDGHTVAVWDLRQSGRIAHTLGPPLERVSMAVEKAPTAVSPDGRYATWVEPSSGASEYKLDCWDLRTSRELHAEPPRGPLSQNPIYSLAYNAAGSRLVSAGYGSVQLWQVHDGCPTLQKDVPLPVSQVQAAGFRDARTIVAVGSDDTLRVLDASSGRQITAWRLRYKGFTSDPVTSAAISPDGEFAAIGLDNGRLLRADTHTGDTRSFIAAQPELSNLTATSISAVTWSRNGQDIALAEGNGAVIVLGRDGQTVMNVPGLGTESLQFMFGGTTLMGVDAKGTAHVWDLGTGSILTNFPIEHFAPPHNGFAFLPDLGGGTSLTPVSGSKLLVTDPGAYPAIFDLGIANLLSHACRTAGRQLSHTEIQQLAAPAPPYVWSCK